MTATPTTDVPWDWYRAAACLGADTEIFYPDRGEGKTGPVREAKAYCWRCPVTRECLEAALVEERTADRKAVFGVRGGLTAGERLSLHDRYRAGAA